MFATEIEKNLLIFDSDVERRTLLSSFFSAGFACDEAGSMKAALEKIREKEYAVLLAAISQKTNFTEVVPLLSSLSPRTVPVFVSDGQGGNTIRAFKAGAFDVVQMPFSIKIVESTVEKAFAQYELKCIKDNHRHHLEDLVTERTAELDRALEEVENSYRMMLKALVRALETRDRETYGHSERVVTFSLRLGFEIGLDPDALRDLELGALLHDIGKIGVPDAILNKPGNLTASEWEKMRLHPDQGQKILRNIPFLDGAGRIVAQHHEKWDGSGYPYGLRGEDIDIGARIFSVVDAFDAITNDRLYRKGISYEEALTEIERSAGTQFDPVIVEAFKRVPEEDWDILQQRSIEEKFDNSSLRAVVAELVYSGRRLDMVH